MSDKVERHELKDDSTVTYDSYAPSKFKRGLAYLSKARQRVKVPKILKKPSVVLICKQSVKMLFLTVIIFLVILLFVLLFNLLSYFLTKIGAILVILYI